jgi:sulfite reductase alpha subunit-like flavoprotein
MIGPGTGCAPFRAFLEERTSQRKSANMLFFGCRSATADFFFGHEWSAMVEAGQLTLHTAFSRDQSYKVYVQHRIQQEGREVWLWMHHRQAHVYIAGNAKRMPVDVQEALQTVCVVCGGLSQREAEDYIAGLISSHRLQLETWS